MRGCFHDDTHCQRKGWPKLAAFPIAAGLVWWLLPGRDGEASALRRDDALLFVPARVWPAILWALGLVFYVVRI